MEPIRMIILGAGDRGAETYGAYALRYPQELNIVGAAEPDVKRREKLAAEHDIPPEHLFRDWKEVFARPKFADLVVISTQDQMHVQPAIAAMQHGYNLLLEKPIAPTLAECLKLEQIAAEHDVSISVSHVLRYTPFFRTLKRYLDNGAVGELRGIQLNENIGHIHYAHSYVRGNWRNSTVSSPMILAKSCHDMDILLYLTGKDCISLSSYGSRGSFSAEKAPAGAPARCLEACPHAESCPYYAPKIYLNGITGWPVSVITNDPSPEGIAQALREGPYGRCVYACDNDMTEYQTVSMQFSDNITASFTLSAFTHETSRTIKLAGDRGEIGGNMDSGEIELFDFETRQIHHIRIDKQAFSGGHQGGDEGLIREFLAHLRSPQHRSQQTPLHSAVQSHIMAFAAQESMEKSISVNLERFVNHVDE